MTPFGVLRILRTVSAYPRSWVQLARARQGFIRHGDEYPHRFLFIAGLPKSGTSWVESMLSSFAGFSLVTIPENAAWDYRHGGTHNLELPANLGVRVERRLVVLKLHGHGSENNAAVLRQAGARYCVLFRDLRDCAVSYVFYVRRTPWHPEHRIYRDLDTKTSLLRFAVTLLPEWRDWVHSWRANRDTERSVEVTYESMHRAPEEEMRRIALQFGLPTDGIPAVVRRHAFGVARGGGSFFRKGEVGDWTNHFCRDVRAAYREVIADDLIEWGYESSSDW